MKKNPFLLSKRVDAIINKTGAQLSMVAIAVIFGAYMALTDQLSQLPLAMVVVMLSASLILSGLQFINFKHINFNPWIPLTISGVLNFLFVVFLAPPLSPFFFVWLITIFKADYFYGRVGTIIMVTLASVSQMIAAFIRVDSVDGEEFLSVIVQISILIVISALITSLREVSDKERRVLVVSMDKAQLERQRLLALINSMNDAVIATDEAGKIKLYNGATLAILDTNQSLDDAMIQDYLHLYDSKGEVIDIIELAANETKNISRTDLYMKFTETDRTSLYVNISPIKLGFRSNSERGFIMTLRDITKEKSLEEERDEFISVVSHELRTPITITEAEISNAQLINDRELKNEKFEKALASAHAQVVFLANMTNDLATLSRAQRDDLDMEIESVNPEEILQNLEKSYLTEAVSKNLKLSTALEGTLKPVNSCKLYVAEILQNFVTNSLKYTKEGEVKVTCESKPGAILFKVSDTGIGISKSDQKKLFDKFFRSEDYRTRESSGTGLGLYVTLKLAKKINAKISVESELNQGSTFSVLVPDITPTDQTQTDKKLISEF